jgi:hypothetical protein
MRTRRVLFKAFWMTVDSWLVLLGANDYLFVLVHHLLITHVLVPKLTICPLNSTMSNIILSIVRISCTLAVRRYLDNIR